MIITKYKNRKLYSKDEKGYVTLARVAEWVRAGEPVEVKRHATGEDITPLVLAEVICQEASRGVVEGDGEADSKIKLPGPELLARVIREGIPA
jgi:polyhydroxyalkanoate synthesis regulator protein